MRKRERSQEPGNTHHSHTHKLTLTHSQTRSLALTERTTFGGWDQEAMGPGGGPGPSKRGEEPGHLKDGC